jgi:hypothetical protein
LGKCEVYVREIRFVIEDELTQAYYLYEARGDCPVQVQGWHHKTFPKSVAVIDIIKNARKDDPVMWPLEAPEEK